MLRADATPTTSGRSFRVYDGDEVIATAELARQSRAGTLTVQGARYRYQATRSGRAYALTDPDTEQELASAERINGDRWI
jgi:hypothetical protein